MLTLRLILHSYGFLGLLEGLWSLSLFFLVLVDGGWHYGMDLPTTSPLYRSATGITLASIFLMQIGNLIELLPVSSHYLGTPTVVLIQHPDFLSTTSA